MADNGMRTARGRITVVQEQHFRLLTDDGRGLLLTLGTFARTLPSELTAFRDAGERVEVEYEGVPGTARASARRVRPVRA